jgi:hypothetical protein
MHGTHVNGIPLVPQTPKQLFNGDKLQFGVNVNRNESKLPHNLPMNGLTNRPQATSLPSSTHSTPSSPTPSLSLAASLFLRPSLRRRSLASPTQVAAASSTHSFSTTLMSLQSTSTTTTTKKMQSSLRTMPT